MNAKNTAALAIAALLIAPTSFLFAQSTDAAAGATQEAAKMVPANAIFLSNLDSQKLTAGTQVKVKLQSQVRLNGGPVLPNGTVLVGQVVDDSTQTGKAKLALRFSEADLKGGKTVPIKATIFNLFQAPSETAVIDQSQVPMSWDTKSLGVDQANVVPGVDLHSSIDSPNSGVIVSTKKADIKLSSDLGLALAIAPRSSAQDSANGY
jgi:hypothetical protein